MFKKILFATDNSSFTSKALPQLLDVVDKNNSEVLIFNTYYIPEYLKTQEGNHYFDLEKMEKNLIDHGNKLLEEVKNHLEQKQIKSKSLISNGPAGTEIVKTAENEGCDLIIIGTRGLGNVNNPLISTVSNYVIHNAKCSVLMVH